MATKFLSFLKRQDWRTMVFRFFAGVYGVFFLSIGIPKLFTPWNISLSNIPELLNMTETWHWYQAAWSAFAVFLLALPLLVLLWKPRGKPLLMQFWAIGAIVSAMAWTAVTSEFNLQSVIPIAVLLVAYPTPRAILNFRSNGASSKPLIHLGILAVIGLLPALWQNLHLQMTDAGSELQKAGIYMHVVFVAIYVPMAAFLASTRRPGWQVVTTIAGIALLHLGGAAIFTAGLPGSWGVMGGFASMVGGVAYIAVTHRQAHQVTDSKPAPDGALSAAAK